MSILNKILLVCIGITAIVLFVLSARVLQAHRVWRESYNKHKEAIAQTQQEAEKIVNGDKDASEDGLRQVDLKLYKVLIGRGRVWDNNIPLNVGKGPDPEADPAKGPVPERVLVTLQTESPNAIEADCVVYAFEYRAPAEGEEATLPTDRATYLGQFTVKQVSGNQIVVRPSVRLSSSEFARVQKSQQNQTPWRLYELMPSDNREILQALTDEQKKLLFPTLETFAEEGQEPSKDDEKYITVGDYLYDGKIITKEQAKSENLHGVVVMVDEAGKPIKNEDGLYTEVQDGKGMFIRTLRDYETFFDEGHRIRATLIDRILVAKRDRQFLEAAKAESLAQIQANEVKRDKLKKKLAEVTRQRDIVRADEAKLDAAIASMKQVITDLIASNEATVAETATIQKEVAQAINARTASVVQNSRQSTAP